MGVGAGLCIYDVTVKKFMFAISSPDEFLVYGLESFLSAHEQCQRTEGNTKL